jgi:hypothetical protein
MAPPQAVIDTFVKRSDSQIMALELLAVAVGLSTFGEMLCGYNVRVWTDNVSGKGALRSGAARSPDHNLLVHGVWLLALRRRFGIWIERVPTDDNISDLPSRESYALLRQMGAQWVQPVLDHAFVRPCEWESVAIKRCD